MQEPQKISSQLSIETPSQRSVDAICQTHGAYKARVMDNPFGSPFTTSCPDCVAARHAEDEARKKRSAAIERENKIARLRSSAGIPARFQSKDFSGYAVSEHGQKFAIAVCKKFADTWAENSPSGASLVLTGGPGTGKTHLACAIANQVMAKNLATVAFGSVATILRHIKDTYRKNSDRGEQDAINDLTAPDLLIIDEIGVQVGSEHEKMLLFEVLNERYQEQRPTILISNLSASDLENYLGHRVMDRYRECGVVVAFEWASHRGAKK